MRPFKTVSIQYADLLEQHAAKSKATGEIDLATQTEVTRLAQAIREIGRTRTKVVDKNSQPDKPKRPYRRRNQVEQTSESVLVS